MILAMAVAVTVDALQIGLGPLGIITFFDDGLDFLAMAVISWAVGFHPLLLPTFIIELVPLVDMVPTWTGCTMAVLLLRKRAESNEASPNHYPEASPKEKPAHVLRDEPAAPKRAN